MSRMFYFDARLKATVAVEADTEAEARSLVVEALWSANVNAGAWPSGDPILFEAGLAKQPILLTVIDPEGAATAISGAGS